MPAGKGKIMSAYQKRTNAKLIGLLGGLILAAAGALYLTGGLEASVTEGKIAEIEAAENAKATPVAQSVKAATVEPKPSAAAKQGGFRETYAEYMAAGSGATLVPERFKGLRLPEGWRVVTDRNFGIGVDIEAGDFGEAVRPVKGLTLEISYKEFGANDAAREQVSQWLSTKTLWYAHRDTRPTDGFARAHFFAPTGAAFDVTLDDVTPAGRPVMLDGRLLYFDAKDVEIFEARLTEKTQQGWSFVVDSTAGVLTVEGAGTADELRTFLAAIPAR